MRENEERAWGGRKSCQRMMQVTLGESKLDKRQATSSSPAMLSHWLGAKQERYSQKKHGN